METLLSVGMAVRVSVETKVRVSVGMEVRVSVETEVRKGIGWSSRGAARLACRSAWPPLGSLSAP